MQPYHSDLFFNFIGKVTDKEEQPSRSLVSKYAAIFSEVFNEIYDTDYTPADLRADFFERL